MLHTERFHLLSKPKDVPEGYIAYNPSSIWTVGPGVDVMWVRVEPDRSDGITSHLGKSVVRPYVIFPGNPNAPLRPYTRAPEFFGEDAAMTRITRRLPVSGKLEDAWLVSYVDPKPYADKPNEVASLRTRFWLGHTLQTLEHIADGPEWMKDIRITSLRRHETPIGIYGRPQPEDFSGNITYTNLSDISKLSADAIAGADFIDETILPVGQRIWGGANDVIVLPDGTHRILAHRAWLTGAGDRNRHYEGFVYDHNPRTRRIREIGVLATADMFPACAAKNDANANLTDGVFTGGGYNGTPEFITFGVRDAALGIARVGNLERFIAQRAFHSPTSPVTTSPARV